MAIGDIYHIEGHGQVTLLGYGKRWFYAKEHRSSSVFRGGMAAFEKFGRFVKKDETYDPNDPSYSILLTSAQKAELIVAPPMKTPTDVKPEIVSLTPIDHKTISLPPVDTTLKVVSLSPKQPIIPNITSTEDTFKEKISKSWIKNLIEQIKQWIKKILTL